MKFLICLLVIFCLISGDFAKDLSITEKYDLIEKLKYKYGSSPIPLSGNLYNDLSSKPRNFTMLVLLTAEGEQFRCAKCWEFSKEYRLVSKAAGNLPNSDSLVVAVADFDDNKEVFRKLGLTSVPYVQYFPPAQTGDDINPEFYDLNRKGAEAEDFAHYLEARANISLKIKRPFNWTKLASVLTVVLFVSSIAKIFYKRVLAFFASKKIWLTFSIVGVLLFISGQMYVQIRGAPYAGQASKGMEIFAGGYGNQYGIEVQIMSFLYGICSLAIVFLTFAPKTADSPRNAAIFTYVGVAVFLYAYSYILKIFREKSHYYPFRLFL